MQTIYWYYPVWRHVENQIGLAMSQEAAILRKDQNGSEGPGTPIAPTIDKRRVIPIDARCEQGNKKIQIQEQNTFRRISRISRPMRRTRGHTTMSPPWSYVNVASNVPVSLKESHIFKTSTEGKQLCKHARRRMAREAFR